MYQCTVDGIDPSDTVSIQWNVNGTSSSSPSFQSFVTNYNIAVDGIGTHNTTLTIPGDNPALNGTTVECLASGFVNGELYGNAASGTLYIQGTDSYFIFALPHLLLLYKKNQMVLT